MKTIKAVLKNNLLSVKFFRLKDLVLDKLNLIIAVTQAAAQATEQRSLEIQDAIELLSENQVFLLKSSIDTVHAAHQSLDSLQAQRQTMDSLDLGFAELKESISLVMHDNRAHNLAFKQLLSQVYDDVHSQKYRLVTDNCHFQSIDIELMAYLYSFLPFRLAIDVGANRGDVSDRLLKAGFEVYAFEPFPPVLQRLQERLGNNTNFHALPYALGSAEEALELHLATDLTEDNVYEDSTYYSSLTRHSLADGLVFNESIPVTVKTLAGLHHLGVVPSQVGLVKIDTEGHDLEVIKGMGDFRYPIVVAEFWDPSFPFAESGAMNSLEDMVPAMRERGYSWHLVIYRIWGSHEISYYCNSAYSLKSSWGNAFFFMDQSVFNEALKWCGTTMPATYFTV